MTTLRPELLDELLADYERPEDLLGDDGLFRQLKKALLERALGAELTDHLGYEKGDPLGRGSGNSRNGHSDKTVLTDDGEVPIAVPRDRNGTAQRSSLLPRLGTAFVCISRLISRRVSQARVPDTADLLLLPYTLGSSGPSWGFVHPRRRRLSRGTILAIHLHESFHLHRLHRGGATQLTPLVQIASSDNHFIPHDLDSPQPPVAQRDLPNEP